MLVLIAGGTALADRGSSTTRVDVTGPTKTAVSPAALQAEAVGAAQRRVIASFIARNGPTEILAPRSATGPVTVQADRRTPGHEGLDFFVACAGTGTMNLEVQTGGRRARVSGPFQIDCNVQGGATYLYVDLWSPTLVRFRAMTGPHEQWTVGAIAKPDAPV